MIKDLTFIPNKVIKGWDIGVSTMKVGEVATLFIKSHYGYGSAGSPPKVFNAFCQHCENLTVSSQIPGDATLVFEIELFDFHGEDITKVTLFLESYRNS